MLCKPFTTTILYKSRTHDPLRKMPPRCHHQSTPCGLTHTHGCGFVLTHHEDNVAYRRHPEGMHQLLNDLPTAQLTFEAHGACSRQEGQAGRQGTVQHHAARQRGSNHQLPGQGTRSTSSSKHHSLCQVCTSTFGVFITGRASKSVDCHVSARSGVHAFQGTHTRRRRGLCPKPTQQHP